MRLRTFGAATAAAGAAAAIYVSLTLPSASVHLDGARPPTDVIGAYHIHTIRSDGSGTVENVARAAARAGMAFIVITDHGDATRTPDPPTYRSGVLCIDAVEVNTTGGHVVGLGLTGTAPYPLAGEPADVIDDIHRLGGKAVIAHPDSPRVDLSWRGPARGFDGVEWLNVDSEWRDKSVERLLGTAARYVLRGPESIASLFTRPTRSIQRLDMASRVEPTFGLAALDAHARIGWHGSVEPRGRAAIDQPSYDAMFRTLADVAVLDQPLSGRADEDAAAVLNAITSGHTFAIVRAFGDGAWLEFSATRAGTTVPMGARLEPGPDPTTLRADVTGAPGARMTLMRDGRPAAAGQGRFEYTASTPGVYRVEVAWPGQTTPWIMSNPITIDAGAPPAADEPFVLGTASLPISMAPTEWHVEHEPTSTGVVTATGGTLTLGFGLGPGIPQGQFAAIVHDVDASVGVDRILFTAQSSRPMRVSVQVKLPGKRAGGERWRRSIYVDETARPYVVPLSEFQPADEPRGPLSPNVARIESLLFVVDTINTLTGSSGSVAISNVALGLGDIPAPQQ